jgi:hypothetical protein
VTFWFVAWAITALLLLGSMMFNGRLVLRTRMMLATMEKMHEKLRESSDMNIRMAKELGEETVKKIEETLKNGK